MMSHNSLHRLRAKLNPKKGVQHRIRQDVMRRIQQPASADLLQRVSSMLQPSRTQRLQLRSLVMNRLVAAPARISYRAPKWIAAFALVLIGLRASPLLFLAPQSIALSSVIIIPTQGDVLLSLHGMWQPISEEVTITKGINIRTGNGEATILLHDDGTIRLAPHTTVTLHDISDQPAPGNGAPTMTLTTGQIWIQGLLPAHLRGITVLTPGGSVITHRGSIDIVARAEQESDIRIWDRTAMIEHNEETFTLLANESIRMIEGRPMTDARTLEPEEYEESWVIQNLNRDAVHQREIAQMQQERRAERAGILPTSPLYSVKRVAEKVDVLFTFNADSRVQKQIDHASTRLSEAAALLTEGSSDASKQLIEYRELLLAIASSDSDINLARAMLDQELVEASAELAAAMPADELYLLKRTVLETTAALSEGTIKEQDVEGMLLVDSLNGLQQAIENGDTESIRSIYETLQPSLALLDLPEEEGGLTDEMRKEILALLENTAEELQPEDQESDAHIAEIAEGIAPFLPPTPPSVAREVPLTVEEIDNMLSDILTRLDIYTLPRSRYNQLQYELNRIEGHSAEGTILRRLFHALEPELSQYIVPSMEKLRLRIEKQMAQ